VTADRLHATPKDYPIYAVVGMYSPQVAGDFVQHVAILRVSRALIFGAENVEVWHMLPPLIVGQASIAEAGGDLLCPAVHITGVADLDPDDCEGIQTWLSIVDKEKRPGMARQYIVKPHMAWERAKETNRPIYRRFSCAGFVVECYASVGINLVTLPEDTYPEVDLETVRRAYPEAGREGLRERYGIPGNGPWRILMAGYVLHAMDRDPKMVRGGAYTPASVAEAHFARSKFRSEE
jgi:hypothetical protein